MSAALPRFYMAIYSSSGAVPRERGGRRERERREARGQGVRDGREKREGGEGEARGVRRKARGERREGEATGER